MKHSTCLATVALIAALCVAGCGQDNSRNDNSGGGSTPTATRTAVPATSTPAAVLTATPTTGATGEGTPTPVATSTPGGGGPNACANTVLTITSGAGSDLDSGWTGISHNQPTLEDTKVAVNLVDCQDNGDCTVDGSALNGTPFGSPLPLAAGGVPACVVNTFREGVSGTYNCNTGCGESSVKLTSSVILAQVLEHPCPNCVGDPTPNDGVKGGKCDVGKNAGGDCDTGGISPVFGPTSNDCLPNASSVGDLPIDITPLTTGTVTVSANVECTAKAFGTTCFCPSQNRPNACTAPEPPGTCPDSGFCDDPTFGACSGEKARSCDPGTGTSGCEQVQPGAGTCEVQQRPCFGTTITRTGTCGTQNGTLVGFFCIAATRAPAINTVSGLPGPGTVSLPVSSVRTPQ